MAAPDTQRLQRASGVLTLEFRQDADNTSRLADLYQRDPCRALLPAPDPGEPLTAVLITTSGGLTGGDHLAVAVTAGEGSDILCTPQAAEKIYRAEGGVRAEIELRIGVGDRARFEWLPQETILFDGARLHRRVDIDVGDEAVLLAGDMVVFGRLAKGERFRQGLFADRWTVRRGGRIVWHDAQQLDDDIDAQLAHPAGFAGAVGQAVILYAGTGPEAARDRLRVLMEAWGTDGSRCAATVVGGLLLARLLDSDAARLRRSFAMLWGGLRECLGRPPAMPRLWRL